MNKTDLIVTDKLDVNKSWNAVWEGRTHIDRADSSWTAELRIPFSQLRYNQQSEDGVWGLLHCPVVISLPTAWNIW